MKTKLLTTAFIGVFTGMLLACPDASFAEKNYWDVPTGDHLEVSLMSLKTRANKIAARNEWLKIESYNLEETMKQMERDFEDLQKHNNALGSSADEYDQNIKDMSLIEKRILRSNMSTAQLQSEYRRLLSQLDLKHEQEQELKDKIKELSGTIEDWRGKVQAQKVGITGLTPEISRYQVLLEESTKSLAQVELEHRKIMSKYERPMQDLYRLKKAKQELADEYSLLEDELEVFNEEQNILKKQIEEIAQKRESDIDELSAQIKDLSDQKAQLDTVLVRAEQKIKLKNIDFAQNPESADILAENLDTVRNENLALQEKMTSLQKALQKIGAAK